MSKYRVLWETVAERGEIRTVLSFREIEEILGFPIDHAFLSYKRELLPFGYRVGKISLKCQSVEFLRIEE